MSEFHWPSFLESRNIPYVTRGPNVRPGWIGIKCPWCGADDPSEHLGINLRNGAFSCWRDRQHHGGVVRLIAKLDNCSIEQAEQIAGRQFKYLPEDMLSEVRQLLEPTASAERKGLELPKEFKRFADVPSAQPFIRYLEDRGFARRDILRFSDYGIYYARRGPYRYRVIFTIVENKKLCCWTGRAIFPTELRYRALSVDPEKAARDGHEPALAATADLLLWYDELRVSKADTLLLCEGPMDALKMRLLGKQLGIVATCFFTSGFGPRQAGLLYRLLPRFRRRLMLLDQGTMAVALGLQAQLAGLGVEVLQLPPKVKDPGEINDTAQLAEIV